MATSPVVSLLPRETFNVMRPFLPLGKCFPLPSNACVNAADSFVPLFVKSPQRLIKSSDGAAVRAMVASELLGRATSRILPVTPP